MPAIRTIIAGPATWTVPAVALNWGFPMQKHHSRQVSAHAEQEAIVSLQQPSTVQIWRPQRKNTSSQAIPLNSIGYEDGFSRYLHRPKAWTAPTAFGAGPSCPF